MKNQNEIVKVTPSELSDVLCTLTKSTVVSVSYIVDDSRSRTKTINGQKQKQLQKLVVINNVYLNHDYTNKVNNLNGTTDFVANELNGRTRFCSTLLISDKTKEKMLDGKVLNKESAKIVALYHNGKEITEAEAIALDLFAPAYYKPKVETTMGRGSVSIEDDFRIINTYLNRIIDIKIQGTQYEVIK